jgi:glycosyltransferase involved in cell wall biosynthesis
MKVLYLVPQPKRPDRIGAYTFLDEEIHALAEAGVTAYSLSTLIPSDTMRGKVRLKSVPARGSMGSRLGAAGFLVKHLGGAPPTSLRHPVLWYRGARFEHLVARVVHEEDIDLIHSHFGWPQGFGGMLARAATGRPLVASLRGNDILLDESIGYGRRQEPFYDRTIRTLVRNADLTVFFSKYIRDYAVTLGARPESTRVIRKGVDLAHFKAADDRVALRRELGLDPRPMILTVAGLIPRKGIHHILDALGRLGGDLDFTFVIVGEGPERAPLEAQADRLGLSARIQFMGRIDRRTIPKYFAACDIFVLASIMEAAGNVLFEAMSSGRPVICTNSGGPPEYVIDGETGFVVPVGDTQAMSEKFRLLLENPELQDALGREGRQRTVGEFDYARMVSEYVGV